MFVCFYGSDAHFGSKTKYTLSFQFMKVKLNSAIKSNTVSLRVSHTHILEKKALKTTALFYFMEDVALNWYLLDNSETWKIILKLKLNGLYIIWCPLNNSA